MRLFIRACQVENYRTIVDLCSHCQAVVEAIRANKPTVVADKLLREHYEKEISTLLREPTGWDSYLSGMSSTLALQKAIRFFPRGCSWTISEKRTGRSLRRLGQLRASGPTTSIYVTVAYGQRGDAALTDFGGKKPVKEAIVEFNICERTNLIDLVCPVEESLEFF